MRWHYRILLLTLSSAFLAGCSVDGQITDETIITKSYSLGQQTGLAISSQNININGYRVSSSVDHMNGIHHKSNNGYQVYATVQGNIASEFYEETRR